MAEKASSKPRIPEPAPKPSGVLPKNVQVWVTLGVALFLVVAVTVLDTGPSPSSSGDGTAARPDAAETLPPDDSRIEEYRRHVAEQARKLAAERDRLQQALTEETALAAPPPSPNSASRRSSPVGDPFAREKREREYRSLFASNIALSYRKPERTANPEADNSPAGTASSPSQPPPQKKAAQAKPAPRRPTYRLREGTLIESVLANRLSGEFSGPVDCMVAVDVHSEDRLHVLIPQGSRLLGRAERVERFGQERLAVVFHRLFLPNGRSVSLERFLGLSQQGETALKDKVDRHYWSIFGSALALGAIGGLTQSGTRFGAEASSGDAARRGAASSLGRSSQRILDRFLNRLPTIAIREGTRVKAYLAADIHLPAYDPDDRPAPPSGESP